jgi:hypothetical protein
MAVRDTRERDRKRRDEMDGLRKRMSEIVERFSGQDVRGRFNALDEWAEAARQNPGAGEVLAHLPEVVRHFNDPNIQVMGAALDAWKAAAKANPGDGEVLQYLAAVLERSNDPDELVRYAANSAFDAALRASPDHPLVEEAKARRRPAS